MADSLFIAGDWGTTSLRLALYDGAHLLDHINGPGVACAPENPAVVLSGLTAAWRSRHGHLAAYLCGMVGSSIGWVEAPYLNCPADPATLNHGLRRVGTDDSPVAIVPGLVCRNPLGAPDVMRGEETQILGASVLARELAAGNWLAVLPGTHTKWALVQNGRIMTFLTAFTGELFALLRDHSTLDRGGGQTTDETPDWFAEGLTRQNTHADMPLNHLLFEVRSRKLIDGLSSAQGRGFQSGLLIGADVAGGLRCFASQRRVVLIGDQVLTGLYATALRFHGVAAQQLDGADCALAGLRAIAAADQRIDAC